MPEQFRKILTIVVKDIETGIMKEHGKDIIEFVSVPSVRDSLEDVPKMMFFKFKN